MTILCQRCSSSTYLEGAEGKGWVGSCQLGQHELGKALQM